MLPISISHSIGIAARAMGVLGTTLDFREGLISMLVLLDGALNCIAVGM